MEKDSGGVTMPMELVALSAKGELERWMERYRGLNAFVIWGILSAAMIDAQKRLDFETQLAASEYAMAQAKAAQENATGDQAPAEVGDAKEEVEDAD